MFLLCINWINRKKIKKKKPVRKKMKLVVSGLHILAVWVGGWWKSYQKCSTFAFGHLLHNDLHQAIWFDWYLRSDHLCTGIFGRFHVDHIPINDDKCAQ